MKCVKIALRFLSRTNSKSYTRFRLVPKSTNLDDGQSTVGITVGYPSDSLASCFVLRHFTFFSKTPKRDFLVRLFFALLHTFGPMSIDYLLFHFVTASSLPGTPAFRTFFVDSSTLRPARQPRLAASDISFIYCWTRGHVLT